MKHRTAFFLVPALLLAAASCHEPEYVAMTADRQGLTSFTVYFTFGAYEDQELTTYYVSDPDETEYIIPIPWYYPETSDDATLLYMTSLRVMAELQPNYRIEPGLGILDLTEVNEFKLYDPDGNCRDITITGERRKSSTGDLITFMIEGLMINGIINSDEASILIPYKEDLSSVQVSGQVSPHATLSKIGTRPYKEENWYNLNTGATVTVTADDGTEKVYSVTQGDPDLISLGINTSSIQSLFVEDPVSILGLPDYADTTSYISLAGNGTNIVVCTGNGSAPILVNRYNGAKTGSMVLGDAVADVITNDEANHLLVANCAKSGETVNIYVTSSTSSAPTLFHSFTNPLSFPVGHRVKVLGDLAGDAIITFTSEGIAGKSTSCYALYLTVTGGKVSDMQTLDFSSFGWYGWGSAPVGVGTVVPASLTPASDGWFVDWYDSNANADLAADSSADSYILHYVNGKGQDSEADHVGNWGMNPNCLDVKTFNNARYMVLLATSHFPNWGFYPRLCFYNISDPASPTKLLDNASIKYFNASYSGIAAGDVVLYPSEDGFYLFVYYYDFQAQTIGAYVADCIQQ